MSAPDDDLQARRDKLAKALEARRAPRDTTSQPAPASTPDAALSLALRASSEIVAGLAVGGIFGWGLDWLAHTKPLFLVVFLLLGVGAGMWNVVRAASPKGGK